MDGLQLGRSGRGGGGRRGSGMMLVVRRVDSLVVTADKPSSNDGSDRGGRRSCSGRAGGEGEGQKKVKSRGGGSIHRKEEKNLTLLGVATFSSSFFPLS